MSDEKRPLVMYVEIPAEEWAAARRDLAEARDKLAQIIGVLGGVYVDGEAWQKALQERGALRRLREDILAIAARRAAPETGITIGGGELQRLIELAEGRG